MRCPTLSTLPRPSPGKAGWPWTEESLRLPDRMADGRPWPCISIVTPSYNQGQFIEETIRSVLLQGYPNLEYIVIDGGSTDDSVEIIRRYESWLTYWTSEPDRGQSHAINKGLEHITGQIFNWINSDDLLARGALQSLGEAAAFNPGRVVCGTVISFDGSGCAKEFTNFELTFENMLHLCPNGSYHQPGVFLPVAVLRAPAPLDESLSFAMDWDITLRVLRRTSAVTLESPVALFRTHSASKTSLQQHLFLAEICDVVFRYKDRIGQPARREWARLFAGFTARAAGRCLLRGRVRMAANQLLRALRMDAGTSARTFIGLTAAYAMRRCNGLLRTSERCIQGTDPERAS